MQTFVPLVLFAFVTSITPGPNNIMLLASGVNFGWRATLPHLLGVSFGFFLLLMAVGLGLGEVFRTYPEIYAGMKWVSAAYFIYLAWAIVQSSAQNPNAERSTEARPMSFSGAIAFQWINPKAVLMAIGYFSSFAPPHSGFSAVLIMAALFSAINLPCLGVWALFGDRLREHLQVPRVRLIFNWTMAVLLLASLLPIFFGIDR
jgi:threonine/homoserine/homoserine lactone efflux protein